MVQTTSSTRPNVDIEDDIDRIISHYPPLQNDRHHFKTLVSNGVVTVQGYVKTPITRRYLLENIQMLPGVSAVNADAFYDDETIRIEAGQVLPAGVLLARVEYGIVVLAGTVPEGSSAEDVVAKIAQVPGVLKVLNTMR